MMIKLKLYVRIKITKSFTLYASWVEKDDSAAFIENDRTYTPIRFISEKLGVGVEWPE